MIGRKQANQTSIRCQRNRVVFALIAFLALCPGSAFAGEWLDWWLTPDQQGESLMRQELFLEAAQRFDSLDRKGAAFFRGGDFESSASVYGRMRTPEAAYNRGNALIMLGRYDEAIRSYESALQARPGWEQASQNLEIARIRKQRLAPPDDDAGGTGGQLEADEIVFDDTGRVDKAGTEAEAEGGKEMSDDEMRAVWLRRVQNDPAEFLRARFSYQLYRDGQDSREAGDAPETD